MIKIERSTAVNPAIIRNGVRQPVTLNMTVTAEELASLTADGGTVTYSVDELEVKTVDFQPTTAPDAVVDVTTVADAVVAYPTTKPIIKPVRKTAKVAQA